MTTPLLNGTLIRDRRHELGTSTTTVADAIGIAPQALTHIENNEPATITVDALARLADYLALPIRHLITNEPAIDPFPIPTDEAHLHDDEDTATLTAVLLRAALTGQHADIVHITQALDWTLDRVHHTAAIASTLLHPAGLRIRINKTHIHITTLTDQRATQSRYITARNAAVGGSLNHHQLLYRISRNPVPRALIRERTLTRLNDLVQQGLARIDGPNIVLTEPVLDALNPHRIPPG